MTIFVEACISPKISCIWYDEINEADKCCSPILHKDFIKRASRHILEQASTLHQNKILYSLYPSVKLCNGNHNLLWYLELQVKVTCHTNFVNRHICFESSAHSKTNTLYNLMGQEMGNNVMELLNISNKSNIF